MILLAVLLASGSVAFALTRHSPGATPRAQNGARPGAAAAVLDRAAAWVVSQVSRTAVVSCDRVMCQALTADGLPAASLLELVPGKADPLPSSVIVATPAVRRMVGSRLSTVYAPVSIASFGSGSTQISVRAIAPQGATAYSAALSADVLARRSSGAQLLHNTRITVSAAARGQIAGGQVDARLLVIIATMAAQRPISIVAFGGNAPGASPGMPLRSADLAPASGRGSPTQLRWMLTFLGAQRGAYLPAQVHPVRLANGQNAVRVEFAAPSPLGLLGAQSTG